MCTVRDHHREALEGQEVAALRVVPANDGAIVEILRVCQAGLPRAFLEALDDSELAAGVRCRLVVDRAGSKNTVRHSYAR